MLNNVNVKQTNTYVNIAMSKLRSKTFANNKYKADIIGTAACCCGHGWNPACISLASFEHVNSPFAAKIISTFVKSCHILHKFS